MYYTAVIVLLPPLHSTKTSENLVRSCVARASPLHDRLCNALFRGYSRNKAPDRLHENDRLQMERFSPLSYPIGLSDGSSTLFDTLRQALGKLSRSLSFVAIEITLTSRGCVSFFVSALHPKAIRDHWMRYLSPSTSTPVTHGTSQPWSCRWLQLSSAWSAVASAR